MTWAAELEQSWRSRIQAELPNQPATTHDSILRWLLDKDPAELEGMTPDQQAIIEQAMDYRYRILQQRYLGVGPDRAYRSLVQRLGGLFLIRNKIRTWVALSRDRQRTVLDVLQEVIQEMLQSDRYMQQQIHWIAQCTRDRRLKNALLLTSTEEYCLRPIRNQPLLIYRFVNYLRRTQRGGMTQVPVKELIRLVSEEVAPDDSEGTVSLLDHEAVSQYQEAQAWEEQQALRLKVQREFEAYLSEAIDPVAAEWLKLYLQGHTQEVIAKKLDMDIKQIYRLREKVSYHAVRVFAVKTHPELVANWLEISLNEHNLGLTPSQWQEYLDSLTPVQRQILEKLRAGEEMETIARQCKLKINQVMGEWGKLYLVAQNLRSAPD